MKKLVLVMALSVMAFSAFAKKWDNYINLGIKIPVNSMKVETQESNDKLKINQIGGIEAGYTGVLYNGFSVKASLSVGVAKTNDLSADKENYLGANAEYLLGLGYAPVHTDHMLLGFYGLLGANCTAFYNSVETAGNKTEYTNEFSNYVMGLNGTFVYTFSKTFSLYSSLTLECLHSGDYKHESKANDGSVTKSKYNLNDSFLVVPSVGLTWKF